MERPIRNIDSQYNLVEYLQRNLKKGYKLEDLRWALINQGYSRINIESAIKHVTEIREAQMPKKPVVSEVKQEPVHVEMPQVNEEKGLWHKFKGFFS